MNEPDLNELDQFERELRGFLPSAPSPQLREEIQRELLITQGVPTPSAERRIVPSATPVAGIVTKRKDAIQPAELPRKRSGMWQEWFTGLGWAGAGAAVAVLVLASLDRTDESKLSLPPVSPKATVEASKGYDFYETSSEMQLVESIEGEVVFSEDDSEPVREVLMSYVEHRVFMDAKTGAILEVDVPREDIVLMPLAAQ